MGLSCVWGAVLHPAQVKSQKKARFYLMRLCNSPPAGFSRLLSPRSLGLIIDEQTCAVFSGPILTVVEHNQGFEVYYGHDIGLQQIAHLFSMWVP